MHASTFDVNKSDKGNILEETWDYMKRQVTQAGLSEELLCEDGIPSITLVYKLAPAHRSYCKRQLFESKKIAVMGTEGMKVVSQLFGKGAVVGIRQKRPAVSCEGYKGLSVNGRFTWMTTLTMRFLQVAACGTGWRFTL